MLNICRELFDGWNKDVRYCHWKSNEHLGEGLNGKTDLDVFVFPDDQMQAEAHLVECKYIKFTPQASSRYPMVDEWIGFDDATGKLVHIHLHYRIITGTKFCKEYCFPVDREMIENRVLDKATNVYISSPELELIILFARIILKASNKQRFSTLGYQDEVNYLISHLDKSKLRILCVSLLENDGEPYFNIVTKGQLQKRDWADLKKCVYHWLNPHKNRSGINCFIRSKYYWFLLYSDLFIEKFFHIPIISKKTLAGAQISICFIGQDGSGKSTLSDQIEKWLRWKIEAHRFYLGSGEHLRSPIKWLMNKASLFRNKRTHSQRECGNIPSTVSSSENRCKKRGLTTWLGMLVSCYEFRNIAKRAFKEIKKADLYSKKGAISIFDRFPQVQFDGIYDGPKIRPIYIKKGYSNWFVNRMALQEERYLKAIQNYQPTIVFKLLLSPEESIRRKPFENIDAVKKKHEITKKLEFPTSEVFVLDATQDYNSEILTVKKLIWQCFLKNQS